MGRGSDLLYGDLLFTKKMQEEVIDGFCVRTFPASVERIVAHEKGFFLLDKKGHLRSFLDGQEAFKENLTQAKGSKDTTLSSSGVAWISEGSILYKTIYPDLVLETQAIATDDLGGKPKLLALAKGNTLFVLAEDNSSLFLKSASIDPRKSWINPRWRDPLPFADFEYFQVIDDGLLLASRENERSSLEFIPTSGPPTVFSGSQEAKDGLTSASRIVYQKEEGLLVYNQGSALCFLSPSQAETKVSLQMPSEIKDFLLAPQKTVLLFDDKLVLYKQGELAFAKDLPLSVSRLARSGNDLLLFHEGENRYLLLPQIF